jgi:hypothetical protein
LHAIVKDFDLDEPMPPFIFFLIFYGFYSAHAMGGIDDEIAYFQMHQSPPLVIAIL